ncbi:MAG: hypothetical protein ACOYXB_10570 [Bacteroidota bacterium]
MKSKSDMRPAAVYGHSGRSTVLRVVFPSLFFVLLLSSGRLFAQESGEKFSIPLRNWELRLITPGHLYPTYLADPLGVRFEVSSQKILYSDFDFQDRINDGKGYLGKLVINPGVRISLLRFSPQSNPNLGVEVDLGVTVPTFMRGGNHDLIGVDGIYYFAISGRPFEWLSLRFSKHHICTHIGDEFNSGTTYSVIDFDPNVTQLPVRDDFILSAAVKPFRLLGLSQPDLLQVYGDFGFFLPGSDFMGERQNKPHFDAYLNLQAGAELEYYFPWKFLGGVYTAFNVSAYQLNSFSPNFSLTGGYLFPQTLNSKRLRIGFNYYNGRSLSNQFYNRKEKFIAFIVAVDV